ncbi:MAG: BLUF domain-containing protein [Erythrobacter sp.]
MASQANIKHRPANEWIGCLTYKSTATTNPTPADLQAIVNQARTRNRQMGITGMLLFEDGCFLQTLEGPPAQLDVVWNAIKRDKRHCNIEVLSERVSQSRLFSQWDLLLYNGQGKASGSATHASAPPAISRYVRKITKLALAADSAGLDGLVGGLVEQGWKGDAIVGLLIEPAARALGDAWLADQCCELDLTIGLSMLQLAGQWVRHEPTRLGTEPAAYRILLATAPGEQHMLGTALLADQFVAAGWQVEVAFPASTEALANQIAAERPDAIDLALSDALPRRHALTRLSTAISVSRRAASNQPTIVSVGGRIFAEDAVTAVMVGADHARRSVVGASISIAELVQQKRKS